MEQETYIFVTHNNHGKGIDLSHSINLFCLSYIISNNSNEFDFLDQFLCSEINLTTLCDDVIEFDNEVSE